jgi:AraC family transcriptional regulator
VDYLRQVQKGIDYIEANLDVDIATSDVARHAGISHWHFQRIFKGLTNETLKTYIRSRRMSGALDALASSQARIIDIALASGFETQESFTRAFKCAFGMTPAAYRKHGTRFQFLRKVRFDAEYLRHIHQSVSLDPMLYDQPELRLAGLHTRFFGVDSEKNNMSRKLPRLWQQFLERLDEIHGMVGETGYGLIRQTPAQTDELDYYASVEVTSIGAPPRGMVQATVPAARYAKFAHRGLATNLDRTVNYIYSTWLAKSGYRHTYGPDLEIYGPEYIADSEQSLIYYAIPVAIG